MPSPRVTVHFAQSLDGKIALHQGRSAWITEAGTRRAHEARRDHDAVLVGAETIRNDNPQLTVRACEGRQPRRVILSSTLRVPVASRVFERADREKVCVIGAEGRADERARGELTARGIDVIVVRANGSQVSLPHALAALRERGVGSLLVEGGARTLASFFQAQLVHRAEIELVPKLLGASALSAIGPLGIYSLAQTISLDQIVTETLGESILVTGKVEYVEASIVRPPFVWERRTISNKLASS